MAASFEGRCWKGKGSSVAASATQGGGQAGDEGADQRRHEQPQRAVGRRLACLVGGVTRGDFSITHLGLGLCIDIAHTLLSVLLRQARALRHDLAVAAAPPAAAPAVVATPPTIEAPACTPPLRIEPMTEVSKAAVAREATVHARKPWAVSRK